MSKDLRRGSSDPEDSDRDRDEYQREDASDEDEDDADDSGADSEGDEVDGPFRRIKRIGEDSEDDEEAEDGDDFDAIERIRKPDGDEEEKEPRRIVFSRDRDLQRYRSASRRKADDNPDEGGGVRIRDRTKKSIDEDNEGNIDRLPESQVNRRFNNRIDDRFVDRSSGQDAAPGPNSWEGRQERVAPTGKDCLMTFLGTIRTSSLNRKERTEWEAGAVRSEMSGKSFLPQSQIRARLLRMTATWIKTVRISTRAISVPSASLRSFPWSYSWHSWSFWF